MIRYFSSDAFAYGETSRVITPLLQFAFPFAGPETLDSLHYVVRKLGHVGEFLITGWLVLRSSRFWPSESARLWVSLIFVLSVAAIDELGQSLTAARGPSLLDVGFDCLGGIFGVAIALARQETPQIRPLQ